MCVRIDLGRYVPWRQGIAGKSCHGEALKNCTSVESVIVVKRDGRDVEMVEGRDHWYAKAAAEVSADCAPEPTDVKICSSSSTLLDQQASLRVSFTRVVDTWSMQPTASKMYSNTSAATCIDVLPMWVGLRPRYIIYGPLLNGATTIMFEGVPTYLMRVVLGCL